MTATTRRVRLSKVSFVNASPAEQTLLLQIAELDGQIRAAEHAKKNPPHAEQVRALLTQRQELSHAGAEKGGRVEDLRTELARIEADVALVAARHARDTERLSATSNAKQAQSLQSELASLERRRNELEDGELEVMQRLEDAEKDIAAHDEQLAALNADGARLSAEGKEAVAAADAAARSAEAERAGIIGGVPEALLAFYDKLAARSAGAAALVRRTCEGCHMVLSGSDLNEIRQAAIDQVLTCPECGCILVRTEESGL